MYVLYVHYHVELVQKLLTATAACGVLRGKTVREAHNISDILRFPHRPLASPHAASPVSIVFSQALYKNPARYAGF